MYDKFIARLTHLFEVRAGRRRSVYALFFVLMLMPYAAVIAISSVAIYSKATDLSIERRSAVASSVSIALQERIKRVSDIAVSLSIHPALRSAVNEGRWADAEEITRLFKSAVNEQFIEDIFIVDTSGISRSITSDDRNVIGVDFSNRNWYAGVMATGKPYLSEVYTRNTKPQYRVVTFAVPIMDDKGAVAGIMGFQMRTSNFFTWSKDIDAGQNGFVYVIDHKGQLVTYQDDIRVDEESILENPVIQKALLGKSGVDVISYDDGKAVVAYEPVYGYNWIVAVQQPTEYAFAARNVLMESFAAAAAIMLVIQTVLIYLVLRIVEHCQGHITVREIGNKRSQRKEKIKK